MMGSKGLIYLFMFVFGWLGSYIPTLWGADAFGLASVVGSFLGGALGIWLGFKLHKSISG